MREVRGAHELEHQVDPAAAGVLEGLRAERSGVDRLGAERSDELGGLVAAHDAEDIGAQRPSDLDGGRPHGSRCAVHEHRLAGAQRPLGRQRVVRGDEHLGDRGGLVIIEAFGHAGHAPLVHGDPRREAAARHQPEDPVARRPVRDAFADLDHRAGDLETRDVLHDPGGRGVAPLSLQKIGRVQPGRGHVDEHFVAGDLGVVTLGDRHVFVAAGAGEDHGSHAATSCSTDRRCGSAAASRSC